MKVPTSCKKLSINFKAKAPILKSQRQDYERALLAHDELSVRLDEALRRSAEAEKGESELKQRLLVQTAQVERDQQMIKDLSRQLQGCLEEQEQRQRQSTNANVVDPGTMMVLQSQASKPNLMDATSPAQSVISTHLVTYTNIEELQVKNAQLLRVVRELSAKNEEFVEKSLSINNESQQLLLSTNSNGVISHESYRLLRKEVDNMRKARERQEALVTAIIQQRDMYRKLLNQQDGKVIASFDLNNSELQETKEALTAATAQAAEAASNAAQLASQTTVNQTRLVENLQNQFDRSQERIQRLEKEKEKVERKYAESMETVENLRSELNENELRFIKLQAQFDNSLERIKDLREVTSTERAELTRLQGIVLDLQTSLTESQTTTASHTVTINRLQNELREAKTASLKAEKEKRIAEHQETLLQSEIASLQSQLEKHQLLSTNLAKMENLYNAQTDAEKAQQEEKVKGLRVQIEKLTEQVDAERRSGLERLKVERLEHAEVLKKSREHYENLNAEIRKSMQTLAATSTANGPGTAASGSSGTTGTTATSNNNNTTSTASEVKETSSSSGSVATSSKLIERLKARVRQLLSDVANLKSRLAQADQSTKSFQAIALAHEKTLRDIEQTHEAQLSRETETRTVLETKVQSQSTKIKELEATVSKQGEENPEMKKLKKELALSLQNKTNADEELSRVMKQLTSVQADVETYREAQKTAVANYEREVQLHSAKIQELKSVRESLENSQKKEAESEERFTKLHVDVIQKEQEMKAHREEIDGKSQALELRNENLTKQNAILHEQFAELTAKLESKHLEWSADALKEGGQQAVSMDEASSGGLEGTSGAPVSTGVSQLIAHLRREKDMFALSVESKALECERLKARNRILQRKITENEEKLSALSNDETSSLSELKLLRQTLQDKDAHLKIIGDQLR
eukprot:g4110.t1